MPLTQAEGFKELGRRANTGNAACLAGLQRLLDERPAIWRAAGDVAALAVRAWTEILAAVDKLAEESIRRQVKALKAGLGGDRASPLEALLVDQVAVTHLATCQAEAAAAQVGGSVPQAALRLRKAESASRRFGNAVKLLTLVKSLLPKSPTPLALPTSPPDR